MYDQLPTVDPDTLHLNEGKRIVIDTIVDNTERGGRKSGPYYIVPEQCTRLHTDGLVMDYSSGHLLHISHLMDKDPRYIPQDWIY